MTNTTVDRRSAADEMPVALTLLLVVIAMALSGGVLLMVVNGLQQGG